MDSSVAISCKAKHITNSNSSLPIITWIGDQQELVMSAGVRASA